VPRRPSPPARLVVDDPHHHALAAKQTVDVGAVRPVLRRSRREVSLGGGQDGCQTLSRLRRESVACWHRIGCETIIVWSSTSSHTCRRPFCSVIVDGSLALMPWLSRPRTPARNPGSSRCLTAGPADHRPLRSNRSGRDLDRVMAIDRDAPKPRPPDSRLAPPAPARGNGLGYSRRRPSGHTSSTIVIRSPSFIVLALTAIFPIVASTAYPTILSSDSYGSGPNFRRARFAAVVPVPEPA